jgi:MerR family transcriptional regulator/heat shock protein HspR
MAKEFWTVTEVLEFFEVDEHFLAVLEEESIVCATCEDDNLPKRKFHTEDMEKLRVAKILMEEMEVNLPGVDIILRMKQNMIEMRKQFDAILEDLAKHVRVHVDAGR